MFDRVRFGSSWMVSLFALAFLAVAGCGDIERSRGPSSGAPGTETVHQNLSSVCGKEKTKGPQGIDVSKYQGTFDWKNAKSRGIEFAYARAVIGTNVDPQFDRNWKQMKKHDIIRGAYMVPYPNISASAQANKTVKKVGGKLGPGELPVAIDVEGANLGGTSKSKIRSLLKSVAKILEKKTGKTPVIYTRAYFWRDHVGSTGFGKYPLWVANYGTNCPLISKNWSDWTIWQYCAGGQYCPDNWGVDHDVFNGSLKDLQKFAGKNQGPKWAGKVVDQTFQLGSGPIELAPGERLSGYVELKNTGSATWNSDTLLGTTEPRDRMSAFADSSWVSPKRPSAVSGKVATGQKHRFAFTIRAPQKPGTYDEYFGLVQKGSTWFGDAGGPADDAIHLPITVTSGGTDSDAGASSDDTGVSMADTGGSTDYETGTGGTSDDAGAAGDVGDAGSGATVTKSGCSSASGSSPGTAGWMLVIAGLALGLRLRRRSE